MVCRRGCGGDEHEQGDRHQSGREDEPPGHESRPAAGWNMLDADHPPVTIRAGTVFGQRSHRRDGDGVLVGVGAGGVTVTVTAG